MQKSHWVIFAMAFSIALILVGIIYVRPDAAYSAGYYAGRNLIPAVVLILILQRFFGKSKDRKFKTGVFLLGYGASIVGSLLLVESKNTEEIVGLEHIVDQIAELYDTSPSINSDGSLTLVEETFAPSPDATGSMAVMQQFGSEVFARYAAFSNDYVVELDAIGWNSILDSDRLQADQSFDESRKLIAEARLVVAKYQRREDEIAAENRQRIQYLDLPGATKENFKQGFLRSNKETAIIQDRIWQLEAASVDEIEKIIDLLAKPPTSWEIQNSQFMFESQRQADQFNEYLGNINLFVAEGRELQNGVVETQRRRLAEFKRAQ